MISNIIEFNNCQLTNIYHFPKPLKNIGEVQKRVTQNLSQKSFNPLSKPQKLDYFTQILKAFEESKQKKIFFLSKNC